MKRRLFAYNAALLFCAAALFLQTEHTMAEELKVGDTAPEFELKGSDGKTYNSAELQKEEKVVVIAWFPKVFTGG